MKNFAQLVDGRVINIIVADDSFSKEDFIEYTESNPAYVGGDYFEGYFYPKQPYSSWVKDGLGNWIAPIEKPQDGNFYLWNEEFLEWVQL